MCNFLSRAWSRFSRRRRFLCAGALSLDNNSVNFGGCIRTVRVLSLYNLFDDFFLDYFFLTSDLLGNLLDSIKGVTLLFLVTKNVEWLITSPMLRLRFKIVIGRWMDSGNRDSFHHSWLMVGLKTAVCLLNSLRIESMDSCRHRRTSYLMFRLLKLLRKMWTKFWIVERFIKIVIFKIHLTTNSSGWSQEVGWWFTLFSLIKIHIDCWVVIIYYTYCWASVCSSWVATRI